MIRTRIVEPRRVDRHQEASIVSCGRIWPGNATRKWHPEMAPRNGVFWVC